MVKITTFWYQKTLAILFLAVCSSPELPSSSFWNPFLWIGFRWWFVETEPLLIPVTIRAKRALPSLAHLSRTGKTYQPGYASTRVRELLGPTFHLVCQGEVLLSQFSDLNRNWYYIDSWVPCVSNVVTSCQIFNGHHCFWVQRCCWPSWTVICDWIIPSIK